MTKRECVVLAEVAQAHEGSVGLAHCFIEAARGAGATGIKFQTHFAQAESTFEEPWRNTFKFYDRSRFDYWKRTEFSEEDWHGLRQHAADVGLSFVSSPFSLEAVELLKRLRLDAWKVASGEVTNFPLLKEIAATGLPVYLSTGMSTLDEIDAAVEILRPHSAQLVLVQATSTYPCPPERIGLNVISELRDRYGCDAGLSDHSGTIYAGLAAAALGASFVEVHLTLSRHMFGPDVMASVTPEELTALVDGIRFIEQALGHPVNKNDIAQELQPLRETFGRSVAVTADLDAGDILTLEALTLKKPGTGIAPDRLTSLVGRRLARSVQAHRLLREEDLEQT